MDQIIKAICKSTTTTLQISMGVRRLFSRGAGQKHTIYLPKTYYFLSKKSKNILFWPAKGGGGQEPLLALPCGRPCKYPYTYDTVEVTSLEHTHVHNCAITFFNEFLSLVLLWLFNLQQLWDHQQWVFQLEQEFGTRCQFHPHFMINSFLRLLSAYNLTMNFFGKGNRCKSCS